jgi:hypothetical protein
LVTARYGIPISGSLESLVAEWAPEPVEDLSSRSLQLAMGLAGGAEVGTGRHPDGSGGASIK